MQMVWNCLLYPCWLRLQEMRSRSPGGSRPKIQHLRLIFVKKVVWTPSPLLPYWDRRFPFMVISHDIQQDKPKAKKQYNAKYQCCSECFWLSTIYPGKKWLQSGLQNLINYNMVLIKSALWVHDLPDEILVCHLAWRAKKRAESCQVCCLMNHIANLWWKPLRQKLGIYGNKSWKIPHMVSKLLYLYLCQDLCGSVTELMESTYFIKLIRPCSSLYTSHLQSL